MYARSLVFIFTFFWPIRTKGVRALFETLFDTSNIAKSDGNKLGKFLDVTAGMHKSNSKMMTRKLTSNCAPAQSSIISQLRNQIRSVETASRADGQARVSSGCAVIDRLLPEGGYQRGTLVQWLTGGGQAADYLSLLAARQAANDGGAIVVFDPQHQFYPPAAAAIGINLDNLIVLKNSSPNSSPKTLSQKHHSQNQQLDTDLLWSIDQALRCPAVAAVWGPPGRIGERWFRRFQLSAESSGCLGLFVQPIAQIRQPSWADVQWLVSNSEVGMRNAEWPGSSHSTFRTPHSAFENSDLRIPNSDFLTRLQLTRCRGSQTGKSINLWINTITGNVQTARRDHERDTKTDFGTGQPHSRRQRTSAANSRAMVS